VKIEILGPGCEKCLELEKNVKQAVKELGMSAEILKVKDVKEIANYGAMSPPVLIVDGDVKSIGYVLATEYIKKLLME